MWRPTWLQRIPVAEGRRLKLLLFIGRLGGGGAERQLALLASGLARRGHEVTVMTLYPGGQHWRSLELDRAVRLEALFGGRAPTAPLAALQRLSAVGALRRRVRELSPDVVYSFLYVANALAAGALRGAGAGGLAGVPLVWGLRASNPRLGLKELPALWWGRRRCRRVDLVVANSTAGVDYHRSRGFRAPRFAVVANGIDVGRFRPDPEAGAAMRRLWELEDGAMAVGQVARLHPMKDHANLLRASAILAPTMPELRLVMVGGGPSSLELRLRRLAAELGLAHRVLWVGEREDMTAVYNALDVAVSASAYGEGFPNAVGEAMACGVPCVVTDVGDSARVVGSLAPVVPPSDAPALAAALRQVLEQPPAERRASGLAGRRRVEERFSVESSVADTESLLAEVACRAGLEGTP
ncbi:MAG: glycosyltransferase [Acidobacteria bacterium]|nr:glycosyltransferase [Acidobacteriota bacterium]